MFIVCCDTLELKIMCAVHVLNKNEYTLVLE